MIELGISGMVGQENLLKFSILIKLSVVGFNDV